MSVFVAGVDYSGAAQVPNDTWLVVGELGSLGLDIVTVKNTGSHDMKKELDASTELKTIAMDFPFSLPTEFLRFLERKLSVAEYQQWQQIAEQLVFMSWQEFDALVSEYDMEPKRFTDKNSERTAQSPLHRVNPSMVQMTYHGMRMLAMLDPKRYFVMPFQDRLPGAVAVMEIFPRELLHLLGLPDRGYKGKDKKSREAAMAVRREILDGLIYLKETGDARFQEFPRLSLDNSFKGAVIAADHALDALIACYGAALFTAQDKLFPDPLDSNNLNILLEGWIYAPSKLKSS
ncbi:MAG: DUF429 domain-containing protein [Candidatus Obscuribacterales bacterium]|nr:DUF429 domain-containing protein [Candidatus Obscuribacterales bacterium]